MVIGLGLGLVIGLRLELRVRVRDSANRTVTINIPLSNHKRNKHAFVNASYVGLEKSNCGSGTNEGKHLVQGCYADGADRGIEPWTLRSAARRSTARCATATHNHSDNMG